jgi:hypothetical protein
MFALRDAVLVLDGGDLHDPPGGDGLVHGHLVEPDRADLALFPQPLHLADLVLERNGSVDLVQLVEIDVVDAQSAQTQGALHFDNRFAGPKSVLVRIFL